MPRVLVIDDQAHVRATISITLQANGFEVVAVESGRMGLRELKKSPFDLAIVDIYMPEMDGVKFIKALRGGAPNLPVIAISGVFVGASERTVLDMLPLAPDLSGVTCLQKPFRSHQLLLAVQQALAVAAQSL
ncbi:MAG: response regulator [Xanthobacteraceae bacterium]